MTDILINDNNLDYFYALVTFLNFEPLSNDALWKYLSDWTKTRNSKKENEMRDKRLKYWESLLSKFLILHRTLADCIFFNGIFFFEF